MIALQDEMDWLVYEAYGLIDDKAGCKMVSDDLPAPLALGQRPFEIWADANKDFNAACNLVPQDWTRERRELWISCFKAIRDNEHIRRIEQPVYKRRWYQPDSYEKQFRKAFEWWLLEKAEWWIENKKAGGPASLDVWAAALWNDERVQAAATVIEGGHLSVSSFIKSFRRIINSETVPEGIPFAVPWTELESKGNKVPAKVKNIRGKLNVPRERFRLKGKDEYLWAGLDWKQVRASKSDVKKDSGQAGMTSSNASGSTISKKPVMTPPDKDNSKTWLALSKWAKETMSINTFWINFALDISIKLKNGSKLSE